MWQLFEGPAFTGRSVVLTKGDYGTTRTLPFGDNSLASLKRVDSLDLPRTAISNSHDTGTLVAYSQYTDA